MSAGSAIDPTLSKMVWRHLFICANMTFAVGAVAFDAKYSLPSGTCSSNCNAIDATFSATPLSVSRLIQFAGMAFRNEPEMFMLTPSADPWSSISSAFCSAGVGISARKHSSRIRFLHAKVISFPFGSSPWRSGLMPSDALYASWTIDLNMPNTQHSTLSYSPRYFGSVTIASSSSEGEELSLFASWVLLLFPPEPLCWLLESAFALLETLGSGRPLPAAIAAAIIAASRSEADFVSPPDFPLSSSGPLGTTGGFGRLHT
mmetsp:Transcript_23482/g.59376  ORF Transcript_23482/g.59376 Transcript_23482/m.59376 type:complete len:260 (+) Transcript_23482:3361-4140(+)